MSATYDYGKYGVPLTVDGNSVLTGEGAGKNDDYKRCTFVEIETWLID